MAGVSKRTTVVLTTETHELRVTPDHDRASVWLAIEVVPLGEMPGPVSLGTVGHGIWEQFVRQVEIARRADEKVAG